MFRPSPMGHGNGRALIDKSLAYDPPGINHFSHHGKTLRKIRCGPAGHDWLPWSANRPQATGFGQRWKVIASHHPPRLYFSNAHPGRHLDRPHAVRHDARVGRGFLVWSCLSRIMRATIRKLPDCGSRLLNRRINLRSPYSVWNGLNEPRIRILGLI